MDKLLFRNIEPSDYQHIIAVVDEWWGGRQMVHMLPKLFFVHFRDTSFVAEHNGNVVGFVIGFISQTIKEEAYIHFVGVHPEFRRRELAQALYEKLFAAVTVLGCHTVRCVMSPVNMGFIAFHHRMGFSVQESKRLIDGTPVAESYDGPGEDRVLFFKSVVNVSAESNA